jgi:Ca2+/Na+ antiporter
MLYWVVNLGLRARQSDPIRSEYAAEIPAEMKLATALLWLLAGLVVLLASARLLVWGAVEIAVALGVSDLIIGLTLVAIGTSLPELAASVVSALRHEHDIAIGNIIGSNMYNLLAVLGLPGLSRRLWLPRRGPDQPPRGRRPAGGVLRLPGTALLHRLNRPERQTPRCNSATPTPPPRPRPGGPPPRPSRPTSCARSGWR